MIEYQKNSHDYIIITAAHNEEKYLPLVIESVVNQTILPVQWIIISDGSTDRTDSIALKYSSQYDFIHFAKREVTSHKKDYKSKVKAISSAFQYIDTNQYTYIAILDADIILEPNYYEKVINCFKQMSDLGIAGGILLTQYKNDKWKEQKNARQWSVSGPIQMFRRITYEDIGGYMTLSNGEDAIAEVMSRMHGWQVKTFSHISARHLRPTYYEKGNILYRYYWAGTMNYENGTHPLFQVARCIKRIHEHPIITGSMALMFGFMMHWVQSKPLSVPVETAAYIRQEQIMRLRNTIFFWRTGKTSKT